MTPDQLAAIKARLAAATPGPHWEYMPDHCDAFTTVIWSGVGPRGGEGIPYDLTCPTEADADLIANAPDDLAALLAYVEQLEGLLRDLCEDSRAAAEVARLRKVIELGARAYRVAAAGTSNYDATLGLLMGAARAAYDALAPPS